MNELVGRVTEIIGSDGLTLIEVDVSGIKMSATFVDPYGQSSQFARGAIVRVLFKDTEVAVGRDLSGKISLRNRIAGKVVEITRGKMFARIGVDSKAGRVFAVITMNAVLDLSLEIGCFVECLIKSNEVLIERSTGEVNK